MDMTTPTQIIPKGYKQTEVGVIPEDWEVKTINETFEVYNNLRFPISEDVRKTMQGVYPYYGPTKIQDYINEFRVEGEYALIGEDGDHFLKWNEIPMTQITCGKFNVNNHAHLIKGKSNITLTKWFYYFFKHRNITQHLARQGAGRYKLSKSTLITIPCVIPPTIFEQNAIANVLYDNDALIECFDKLIVKKKAIKQGTMQELLTGKKRLPGFSGKWEVKKLGDIFRVTRGQVLAMTKTTKDRMGEYQYPVYSSQTKDNGLAGYFNEYLFDNCITWTTDGANAGDVKYRTGKFYCTNVCGVLENNEGYSNLCVAAIFNSVSKKYVSYVGNPKLMNNVVSGIDIFIPCLIEEQTAIATILSDMDAEIEKLEQKRDKYTMLKQGMMQQLLTGKIRLINNE